MRIGMKGPFGKYRTRTMDKPFQKRNTMSSGFQAHVKPRGKHGSWTFDMPCPLPPYDTLLLPLNSKPLSRLNRFCHSPSFIRAANAMTVPSSSSQPLRGLARTFHSQGPHFSAVAPVPFSSATPSLPPAPDTAFFVTLLKACETDKYSSSIPPLPSADHPYFNHIALFWSIVYERCSVQYRNCLKTRKWQQFINVFRMLEPNLGGWIDAGRQASRAWFVSVGGDKPRPPPRQPARSQPLPQIGHTPPAPKVLAEGAVNNGGNKMLKRKMSQEDVQGGSSDNPIVLENDDSSTPSLSSSYPSPTSPTRNIA